MQEEETSNRIAKASHTRTPRRGRRHIVKASWPARTDFHTAYVTNAPNGVGRASIMSTCTAGSPLSRYFAV